ncbi:MAG: flagellar filament capping protein FliD [Sporolactobacillus sp.]
MPDASSIMGTSSTNSSSTSSSNSISINTINALIGASGSSNSGRVSGLVSGIDVDSIVAQLMSAQSQPLLQLQQQLQIDEWKRDDYRSMNTLLTTLQTNVQTMKLQGSYLAKTATSSNSALVTATAGATAGNATYTLSNIKMATSAYNNSTSTITSSPSVDPSQSMWDLVHAGAFTKGVTWNKNAAASETKTVSSDGTTFSLNHAAVDIGSLATGSTITVKDSSGSEQPFTVVQNASDFKADGSAGAQVLLDRETGTMTFNQTLSAGSTIQVPAYNYDSINFSITTTASDGTTQNKKDFSFDPSASLNDIMTSISQSTVGVSAFYDPTNQMVSLTRTDTGNLNASGPEMQLSGSFLTQTLQLDQTEEDGGTDASYNVNGLTKDSTSHSNTFALAGVTFTLQGNSASPTDSTTVRVNTDTDTVSKSISSFIDLYNTTISAVNGEIDETRNRDYAPLTSVQQAQMSASDIAAWNAKAQSGMLAHDNILSSALSQMRTDLYSPVSGTDSSTIRQLAAIGITTSTNYQDQGKLVISDPDKLNTAISTNPQAVMELFTNTGTTTNSDGTKSTDYASEGIMQRLNTTITNTMNQVETLAGNTNSTTAQYSMGSDIDDLNDQITAYKTRLQDMETRYYNQFDAMESAIEQANSQAGFLSQLSGS